MTSSRSDSPVRAHALWCRSEMWSFMFSRRSLYVWNWRANAKDPHWLTVLFLLFSKCNQHGSIFLNSEGLPRCNSS